MLETVNLDNALAAQDAVSDAAYIFAQTSNGDTVKISKADLASVVAGIFTSDRLWKIVTYNQGGVDLNELAGACMVYFVNGSNAPSGNTAGCCLQFAYGSSYKIQFYPTNSSCYIRTYSSAGGWLAWTKIAG